MRNPVLFSLDSCFCRNDNWRTELALFNYATKEITLKIVYYGPGLSGKTTNLQQLHSALDPTKTGKLLSLATETDRTLFFDFLPVELGKVKDFSVRFQLYTVPGQVKYNATRKVVLKGADAVVFVADSQREMREANIESFANMKENLLSNNINPDDIPVVLQYNKRDLPDILSIDELNQDLNRAEQVYLETEAINGKGVQETFQLITKLLIKDISRRHKLEVQPAAPPVGIDSQREEPVARVLETIIEKPFEEEKIPMEEPVQPAISLREPIAEEEKIAVEEPVPPPVVEGERIPLEEPVQPLPSLQEQVIKEEKEEWKEPEIKEVPIYPVEKLDKMAENLRETSQLLISTKVEIKRVSDELRKLKEDQKELLNAVIKINEIVERIEGKKRKKGWFGL